MNRIGEMPMTVSASISPFSRIDPTRLASCEPDLPATMMPVINGANSRGIDSARPKLTCVSAPKIRSEGG